MQRLFYFYFFPHRPLRTGQYMYILRAFERPLERGLLDPESRYLPMNWKGPRDVVQYGFR